MEINKPDIDNKRQTKVYEELDVFGKYQLRLSILILLSTIPNAFITFQFFVIHYTPQFYCDAINGTNFALANNSTNSSLVDSRLVNTCKFNNNTGLILENGTLQYETEQQMVCTDWTFEGAEVSAVTEFGMICNNEWQRPFTVSMLMFGKLFGGLLGGLISDKFGRKPTFLIFSAWQFLSSFATSFTQTLPSYAAMMFLAGCGDLVNYIAALLLGTEMVGPKKRSLVYVFTSVGFAIGCTLIAPLAFFMTHWRWYLRLIGLLGLLYIPYIWLLDESPRWLLAVGKKDEAQKVLKKIAKFNKMQSNVSTDDSSDLLDETDDSIGLWPTCKLIARTPTLLKRLAVVGLSWLTCSGVYYTISLDIGSLSGNRYVNMLFSGLAELAATGLYFIGSRRFGCRNFYVTLMGILVVVLAVGPLLNMSNVGGLQVALVIVGRLVVSAAFSVVYVYTLELFPTSVRNLVMGYSSGLARVGSMLSPFIIFAGHQSNSVAVPLGMAAFLFFTTVLYVFMPQTKKTQLPQTVQEAVELKSDGVSFLCQSWKRTSKTARKSVESIADL